MIGTIVMAATKKKIQVRVVAEKKAAIQTAIKEEVVFLQLAS